MPVSFRLSVSPPEPANKRPGQQRWQHQCCGRGQQHSERGTAIARAGGYGATQPGCRAGPGGALAASNPGPAAYPGSGGDQGTKTTVKNNHD